MAQTVLIHTKSLVIVASKVWPTAQSLGGVSKRQGQNRFEFLGPIAQALRLDIMHAVPTTDKGSLHNIKIGKNDLKSQETLGTA